MLFLYNRHERKKQNKKEIYLCVSPLLCVDDSKKTLVHLRGKAGINGLAQGLGRTRPQRTDEWLVLGCDSDKAVAEGKNERKMAVNTFENVQKYKKKREDKIETR
ncbi:hypothetical protein POVCU2_0041890 [Plasmodium ovale curtisi]|uniref:Uncharacterized protein n=1 Tax=Plasmodium ovale curtisi TaxID=864141 RepID=A0A1A8W6I2_PLAOA|nr:hypothetical protein POVCU2_0041890 [Plasmodium ovale curtisi]